MPIKFDLSAFSRRRSAKFALASLIAVVAIALVTFTARARWTTKSPSTEKGSAVARLTHKTESPQLQGNPSASSRLHSRLSFQPEADRMRRLLGQRFLAPGREVATLVGGLKLGAQQYVVRITRNQEEDGENVTVGLNGGPAALTWNDQDGVKVGNAAAISDQLALLERIALDSPDQFVIAQTRGATYETIAQQVRPSEAGGADDYRGPVWDLVMVTEPSSSDAEKPLSNWRVYYINSVSGLIEKVASQEGRQRIVSEVSGWRDQGGEKFPTGYVWKVNDQTLMTLTLTSVTFNAKQ